MLLPLLLAANPIFTDTFTADPAPIVDGDTCYVITTEDENDGTPGQWLIMNHWRAYSSKNMKDWTYHGRIMDWSTYAWGKSDSWASQVVKGADGKFYHYTTLVGRGDLGTLGVLLDGRSADEANLDGISGVSNLALVVAVEEVGIDQLLLERGEDTGGPDCRDELASRHSLPLSYCWANSF